MRRFSAHIAAATTIIGALILSEGHAETRIPGQVHLPTACAVGDEKCVREWYQEYKMAILNELRQWRQFEPRVATAINRRDDRDANRMLGGAMNAGWYVHNHWELADNLEIVDAGIASAEWEALFAGCRAAIIHLKFLIIAMSGGHWAEVSKDQSSYVQAVTKCAQFFKLEPAHSQLRR